MLTWQHSGLNTDLDSDLIQRFMCKGLIHTNLYNPLFFKKTPVNDDLGGAPSQWDPFFKFFYRYVFDKKRPHQTSALPTMGLTPPMGNLGPTPVLKSRYKLITWIF